MTTPSMTMRPSTSVPVVPTTADVTGSVGITVNDNDSPGLLVDPGTLNITEGDNGNFSIRLATQPSENVTVTVAQPSNTDITVDTDSGANGNQTTLTFTIQQLEHRAERHREYGGRYRYRQ